jgi:hypothetical protein
MPVTFNNQLKLLVDNKELIPEFFTSPDFFSNKFQADLGTNHMGEPVQNVQLPDWAETPQVFCLQLKKALEKAPVQCWIDLVFGC